MFTPTSLASWTRLSTALVIAMTLPACSRDEPARQYPLTGQILAIHTERNEVTVKHHDIPNFMPGMTMSFAVPPELMRDRVAGELITATLEVRDTSARLTAIERTGVGPLPETTNEAAMAAGILDVGDEVPDAAFLDQSDARRSFSEWRGSYTLLTFIYTSCPVATFCPLMDQNFATLQDAILEDPLLRGKVRLVSISFDPERDTPQVLAAHAKARRADPRVWTYLTGDRVTVDRFAGRFGVSLIRPSGDAEITHNLRTTLVGPDGRIRHLYSHNEWTPGAVLADLRTTLRPS